MKTLLTFVLCLIAVCGWAQNSTIHALPNNGSPADDATFIWDTGTQNFNIRWDQMKRGMGANTNQYTNFFIFSTNIYYTPTYVSNYFATNVFNNTYVSNYFRSRTILRSFNYTTNINITNLINNNLYVSNFWQTNIFASTVNNISNYFATNLFSTTQVITTNVYLSVWTNQDNFIWTLPFQEPTFPFGPFPPIAFRTDGSLFLGQDTFTIGDGGFATLAVQGGIYDLSGPGDGTSVAVNQGDPTNLNDHRIVYKPLGTLGIVTDILPSGPSGVSWSTAYISSISQFQLTASTPSPVLTNGESLSVTFSNNVAVDPTHTLAAENLNAVGVVTNDATGVLHTTPTLPNTLLAGSGAVTVNGTANHITTTSASIALGGSATLDIGSDVATQSGANAFSGANVFSASNFVSSVFEWATNSNNTTPDFAVQESLLSTNASFKWLPPIHLSSAKSSLWIITYVTNSSASAITMTAPDNVNVCGSGSMSITKWGYQLWHYYPPSGPTNIIPIPGF